LKILLTGAAGFIGSHLAEKLLARGDEVIALDNFNDYYNAARKEQNIKIAQDYSSYRLYRTDLRDYESLDTLFRKEQPEKICHIAGMAGVRYSLKNPLLYEEVNVRGTQYLLDFARLSGIQQVVMASSSSVYGGRTNVPFSEDDRVDYPPHPYATTKRAAELLGYTYSHVYGLKVTALRFFTVYGPRNRPDMAVYLFTNAIDKGEPLKLFGDGSARRDWTYVDDTVKGVIAAIDRPFDFEIINLGNSHTHTELDFIRAAEQSLGKQALINHLERPASEPLITYADISKARRLLDFEPVTSFEEGYANFFEWYQNQGKYIAG
jgi:UDP-glucuronate 4-epimerase